MTKEDVASLVGEFSWDFGDTFFIETSEGNFIWRDPSYNGDNTIRPFSGSYEDFIAKNDIPFCRSKGTHVISSYIGEDFIYCEVSA